MGRLVRSLYPCQHFLAPLLYGFGAIFVPPSYFLYNKLPSSSHILYHHIIHPTPLHHPPICYTLSSRPPGSPSTLTKQQALHPMIYYLLNPCEIIHTIQFLLMLRSYSPSYKGSSTRHSLNGVLNPMNNLWITLIALIAFNTLIG